MSNADSDAAPGGDEENSGGAPKSKWWSHWKAIGGAVAIAFAVGFFADDLHLRSPIGPGDQEVASERPRPAEFLYLDNQRVAAYLAQLEGGIANSEKLSETLTREESAKLTGGNLFEVGASAQHQNFVEREITPTAAASYFRLFSALRGQEQLEDVSAANLDDFEGLEEGSFVRFSSRDLRTPIYTSSYLVVRQAGTLSALFPSAGASAAELSAVKQQRADAKGFAHQIGPNPRIVYALTPRRKADGPGADESVKFLMPLRYRQLTDERSLVKEGGGRFTVVGKLVRVFAKSAPNNNFSYVDSPTLETWKRPLEGAPRPLLRRSSRKCDVTHQGAGNPQASTQRTLTRRECVLARLEEQTRIPHRGAVILPVAIYK